VLIEGIDVTLVDIPTLLRWAPVYTPADASEGADRISFEDLLRPDRPSSSVHGLSGDGLALLAVRVPVVRLADDGQAAIVSRDLTVIAGDNVMIRLWLPIQGGTRDDDPRWMNDEGYVDPLSAQHRLESWWHRCPHHAPFVALGFELRCAAYSHLRVAEELRTRLGGWQTELWTTFAAGSEAATTFDASIVAELARLGQVMQRSVRRTERTLTLIRDDDRRTRMLDFVGFRPDQKEQALTSARDAAEVAVDALDQLEELAGAVRDSVGVLAATSLQRLMESSQAQQRVAAHFERRVAILAGVLTGPAIVAGLAGTNIDFWPLPSENGVLAAGALPVIVVLCIVVGALAWRYLRPEP